MKNPEKIGRAEKAQEGLRVYDPKTNEAHTLKATAALVWEHCDGPLENVLSGRSPTPFKAYSAPATRSCNATKDILSPFFQASISRPPERW